jgi:hypothetical protein
MQPSAGKDDQVLGSVASKRILQMSFSYENNVTEKLALLLSDDHEYTVMIIDLKFDSGKGKNNKGSKAGRKGEPEFIHLNKEPIEKTFTEILTKVTFNPKNDTELCTSGVNHWKVWRLNPDNQLKSAQPFHKNIPTTNRTFTDHIWIDKTQLLGCTSEGEFYFVDGNGTELKQVEEHVFQDSDANSHVVCIQKFSKGFFLASN